MNHADIAWMLMATALVMLMTPAGLALFYGGLTRSKNVLNTVGMSVSAYAIATVSWVVIGYTLAFGPDIGGVIGGLDALMLRGIAIDDTTGTIPTLLFVAFQGTFAAITVAIISGSVVERMKYSTWLVFALIWPLLGYAPLAHWVWGGGFLGENALDFAGGTVVHINSGVAGLTLALLLGRRSASAPETVTPSSIKLTVLGASLLWFGWFGFNAGSALEANPLAASALLVTNLAAAAGALGFLLLESLRTHRASLLGTASGAVGGLVGITPAAGFVGVGAALIIGFVAGMVAYFGVYRLKRLLGHDDTLDAFGIHGLAGIWGALATGLLANPAVNAAGIGALYGDWSQLWNQLVAIVVTVGWSIASTTAVYFLASTLTGGGRVAQQIEVGGLDKAIHGERGFNF